MVDAALPPHDLLAEAAVLSAILIEGTGHLVDALGSLSPESFYSEAHRVIFEGVQELHRGGKPTDSVTIISHLKAKGRLEQVGGASYVTEILNAAGSLLHAEHYAEIVWRKARRRNVILAAQTIAAEGYVDDAEAEADDKFCDRSAQTIFDVTQTKTAKATFHVLADVAHKVVKQAIDRSKSAGALAGVPTGLAGLDRFLGGLQPTRLYVLAARPGVGKTALAVNIAAHVANQNEGGTKKHVAFFSLEMNAEAIATRVLGVQAGIESRSLMTLHHGEDGSRIFSALQHLPGKTFHVADDPNQTVLGIKAAARKLRADVARSGESLSLIVVDYLQLMDGGSKRRNDSREQEVSAISRGLKKLAMELECPILALSQLNRGVEARGGDNARPKLSDLRESGAIEQDANVVLLLHRPPKPKSFGPERPDRDEPQAIEAIVAKNREGPTGVVRLRYDGKVTRFSEDYEPRDEESFAPPPRPFASSDSASEARQWWE